MASAYNATPSPGSGADGPPSPRIVRTPPDPGVVVHAQDGRIVLVENHTYAPADPVDLRCPGCTAAPEVRFDQVGAPGIIAFIEHHEHGCQALADQVELRRRSA
jgi:hypothetical protein